MMDPKNPLTPGVYIQELNEFPNTVVEVATAVPVFIGYTQKSSYNGVSLALQPVEVISMNDYINFFGGAPVYSITAKVSINGGAPPATSPKHDFSLTKGIKTSPYVISSVSPQFYLFNSMQLFFQNGGGKCYVVSVGTYKSTDDTAAVPSLTDLQNGLNATDSQDEITLIVIPDGLLLDSGSYSTLMANMLQSCNNTGSRFSLFDILGGNTFVDPTSLQLPGPQNPVSTFRDGVGENYLHYGAAYFPWLQTTVIQKTDINFRYFDAAFITALKAADSFHANPVLTAQLHSTYADVASAITQIGVYNGDYTDHIWQKLNTFIEKVHGSLLAVSQNYTVAVAAATKFLNILPAAPAMAGVYTVVDEGRGVWKAPANVSLTAVTNPLYNFTNDQEASTLNLNVDALSGKSINIIRSFPSLGTMVWGARTLDGNSDDWRYISVRRTMIMIEQSVKLAVRSYVFAPNVSNTWIIIQCMISNFLNSLWRQGALAGATAEDAYSVSIGLGSTMTAEDILLGIMKISVLVAVANPAEFLIITFQQQMQKS